MDKVPSPGEPYAVNVATPQGKEVFSKRNVQFLDDTLHALFINDKPTEEECTHHQREQPHHIHNGSFHLRPT